MSRIRNGAIAATLGLAAAVSMVYAQGAGGAGPTATPGTTNPRDTTAPPNTKNPATTGQGQNTAAPATGSTTSPSTTTTSPSTTTTSPSTTSPSTTTTSPGTGSTSGTTGSSTMDAPAAGNRAARADRG
jgi:hypothetical protein